MSTIKNAVDDLLTPQVPIQEAMDRHFAPDFRQRVNGNWIDRTAFLDGMVRLRQALKQAKITVIDEVATEELYAERHVVDLVMHDGARVLQEVYVFAQRGSDGRFVRIEEATVALGDELSASQNTMASTKI
ncbi:nuclear transport factor 2 family protein [Shewanella fodinae]|jgi:hypothetical protein|uniref:nuclear transport factor 2 family protein n=1 Tax=Shewanella fodinae TaxID=552357 RepID=UPI00167B30AD|nr:nuclear transport factor 2 family protein [Shewanella fodinae]MCL2906447.1 hypothetical protein [Shewanella fodinae]GGY93239.1 hypothetical protein GCM10007169_07910 [Shewanella fodinae]